MKKTKKELEEKKEYARLLFMQGEQQKIIADKTQRRHQPDKTNVSYGPFSAFFHDDLTFLCNAVALHIEVCYNNSK